MGEGEHRPAIITSHSTSNSGSSRGFLKKRLTSPIMGSALMSSFVSPRAAAASPGVGSSGRARTMNVSSGETKKKRKKMRRKWYWGGGATWMDGHALSSSSCQLSIHLHRDLQVGSREGGGMMDRLTLHCVLLL